MIVLSLKIISEVCHVNKLFLFSMTEFIFSISPVLYSLLDATMKLLAKVCGYRVRTPLPYSSITAIVTVLDKVGKIYRRVSPVRTRCYTFIYPGGWWKRLIESTINRLLGSWQINHPHFTYCPLWCARFWHLLVLVHVNDWTVVKKADSDNVPCQSG
mgnify:CR=1 FL=1